ncbi:LysR family transcriptional regulator [Lutimaribacter marinistellae]|uniref:LysR family transcriptional regulator n=1 Tax=Lutimaribacter marinistellae TaxID=1820329 RepID=A0ABV7TBN4_9RHOB
MKLDPRHLEILAAIVDQGGLTEGAQSLGKSQPSVSRTLAQLEARIGSPLFLPGRRPLQPTDLGLALAEQGRTVLRASRIAGETADRYRSGRSGMVRLGGTPIFMDGVIAPFIALFQGSLPDVRVDQTYGYAGDLVEGVRNTRFDIAVLPLQKDQVPSDLDFHPLLPGHNVIACRAGHPLTRRKLVTLADIAEFPWIAPPTESPLYKDLQQALAKIGAEDFRISFSGGSLSSVFGVLTGSDSLTVLPYSVIFSMKSREQVAALSLDIGHPDRTLGLLVTGPDIDPAVRRFRQFLIGQFEAMSRRMAMHGKERLWR